MKQLFNYMLLHCKAFISIGLKNNSRRITYDHIFQRYKFALDTCTQCGPILRTAPHSFVRANLTKCLYFERLDHMRLA